MRRLPPRAGQALRLPRPPSAGAQGTLELIAELASKKQQPASCPWSVRASPSSPCLRVPRALRAHPKGVPRSKKHRQLVLATTSPAGSTVESQCPASCTTGRSGATPAGSGRTMHMVSAGHPDTRIPGALNHGPCHWGSGHSLGSRAGCSRVRPLQVGALGPHPQAQIPSRARA